jgi:hypothetical protein
LSHRLVRTHLTCPLPPPFDTASAV